MKIMLSKRPKGYLTKRNFFHFKIEDGMIPQEVLDIWANMTDENLHTECRLSIAQFLEGENKAYNLYVKLFDALVSFQNSPLNDYSEAAHHVYEVSYLLYKKMLKDISEDFGKDIARQIYSVT